MHSVPHCGNHWLLQSLLSNNRYLPRNHFLNSNPLFINFQCIIIKLIAFPEQNSNKSVIDIISLKSKIKGKIIKNLIFDFQLGGSTIFGRFFKIVLTRNNRLLGNSVFVRGNITDCVGPFRGKSLSLFNKI